MSDRPDQTRRALLAAAPLGVAATGLAAASGDAVEAPAADQTEDPRDVTLKDTQHIRTYYTLARG